LPSEEPSLGDVLDSLVDEAGDVESPTDREFARDGVVFATRPADNVMDLRLGDEIAEAALRTPDTTPSERGPAWVHFAPQAWDEFAFDRLEAWFRVAWRMAVSRR
jgi:hypothetical protein